MADETLSEISLDFSKLKVPDLKKELKMRGLSSSGNKTELLERLQTAVKSNNDIVGSESVDDLDEDLLNDDDDEHLDASESVILESELDDSPKALKRKLDISIIEPEPEPEPKSPPPKKVILNRNTSLDSVIKAPVEKKEKVPEIKLGTVVEEKKVVKLSELSAKERLEMRAKKFGVTDFSADAKKVVRAERFGINSNSASSITSSTVNTSVDVLKKRADRFGGSVSTVMSSLASKEKLEKRKARFGGSDSTNATNGAVPESEKVKQRIERFKEPVK